MTDIMMPWPTINCLS